MPVEVPGGFPCKNCGCTKTIPQEKTTFYWVEVNYLLRKDIIDYICWNCEKVLIKVINHTEEKY